VNEQVQLDPLAFQTFAGGSSPPASPEPYVDATRAAEFLAIATKTVNQWARQGKLPAYPWGDGIRKTWRFRLSELDGWMRARLSSANRPPLALRRSKV
jgi:excisionase family DNA binding protein